MGSKALLNASIDKGVLDATQATLGRGNVSKWIENKMRLLVAKPRAEKDLTDEHKLEQQENIIVHLKDQLIKNATVIKELNDKLEIGKEKYENAISKRGRRL